MYYHRCSFSYLICPEKETLLRLIESQEEISPKLVALEPMLIDSRIRPVEFDWSEKA